MKNIKKYYIVYGEANTTRYRTNIHRNIYHKQTRSDNKWFQQSYDFNVVSIQTGIILNVYYDVRFVILLCIVGCASIRVRRNRLNIFYSLKNKKVCTVEWIGIKK